jgi:hypothetical protein
MILLKAAETSPEGIKSPIRTALKNCLAGVKIRSFRANFKVFEYERKGIN